VTAFSFRTGLLLIIAIASWISPPSTAFDGTDASPPRISSMRLLTSAPTMTENLVVIEVLTEDDKNWVEITGNPQLGYSYVISNRNVAPNCATVTRSFSKLEVVEDEITRALNQGVPRRQRFLLIGMAPMPIPLPSNCPEYRSLNLIPAVALNSTSFPTTVNRSTGVMSTLNNILTPAIQDESGRVAPPTTHMGITPISLTLVSSQVGITPRFCISPALLHERNQALSTSRSQYLIQLKRLADAGLTFYASEVIREYESQVQAWSNFLSTYSIKQLSLISKCETPLSATQINSAYQSSSKSIDSLIAQRAKEKLESDCNDYNRRFDRVSQLSVLLRKERLEDLSYEEFSELTKSTKAIDCKRTSSASLEIQLDTLGKIEQILIVSEQDFLNEFCTRRNSIREQFFSLYRALKFRYPSSDLLRDSQRNLESQSFSDCDSKANLEALIAYSEGIDSLITKINTVLQQSQNLEKKQAITTRIECKAGKSTLKRKSKSPKCPAGYIEVRLQLKPLSL